MGNRPSKPKWFQTHEALCIKIIRWLVIGLGVSILPVFLPLLHNSLSDLVVAELDSLLDRLLIIIAISANVVNLLWDKNKNISFLAKIVGTVLLSLLMIYCVYTYAVLFQQTIYHNKLLEEYSKLSEALETMSVDFTNTTKYEETMQHLSGIKYIIDTTSPNPDRLNRLKIISRISIVGTGILGIVIEFFDDRNNRKHPPNDSSL